MTLILGDVIECARTGNSYHPTEKPADLMRAVIEWTRGIVLAGSGSRYVAASFRGRPL